MHGKACTGVIFCSLGVFVFCVYCLQYVACASGDTKRVSKAFFICKDIVDLI